MGFDHAAYAEMLEKYDGLRTGQHDFGAPGCIDGDHCEIHHVDEPVPLLPSEAYRTCSECGHVYLTEMDLQAADLRQRESAWQATLRINPDQDHTPPAATDPDQIWDCPLCTHDF